MQNLQPDGLIPKISKKLDSLNQGVRQKQEIILKRNSLHLALPAQAEGKQSSLVQDGIQALFPKHNGDTKQLVPCRERVAPEKMRRAQMLVSPIGEIGNSPMWGNRGEEASVGEMSLRQSSQGARSDRRDRVKVERWHRFDKARFEVGPK